MVLQAQLAGVRVNRWTPAADLSVARSAACSVLLSDGRVLVAGGSSESGVVDTVELYDSNGRVKSAAPMAAARAAAACALLPDGKVLVAGGNDGSSDLASAEIYDPAKNAWQHTGSMLTARSGHTATATPWGAVLIAGGGTDSVEVFATNGEFKFAGNLSSTRKNYVVAAMADRKVMIAGGSNGQSPVRSIDIYDADTNKIVSGGEMLAARSDFAAVALLDGTVLIAGGLNAAGEALSSTEIYYPDQKISAAGPDMPAARASHLAYRLPNNGQVLLIGGSNRAGVLSTSDIYTPWLGKFTETAPLSFARTGAAGSAMARAGALIVAGGKNSAGYLAGAEIFGFATIATDKPDYAPGEEATVTGAGWKAGERVRLETIAFPADKHTVEFTGSAVADGSGRITLTGLKIDSSHLGMKFMLTATGSESQAQTLFTDGLPTSITLATPSPAEPPNPVFGTNVTFTGTVLPAVAGIGGNLLTVTVNGVIVSSAVPVTDVTGAFTYSTTALAPGVNTIGFRYNGNATYDPSALTTTSYIIAPVNTATTMTGTAGTINFGTQTNLTATVAVSGSAFTGSPTGALTFTDGTTSLPGSVASTGAGQTNFIAQTPTNLSVGSHTFTASYAGATGTYNASVSGNNVVVIVQGGATTSVLGGPLAVTWPAAATYTVTVSSTSGGTPTGNVNFLVDGISVSTQALVAGVATASLNLSPGARSVRGEYVGGSGFTASTSNSLAVAVAKAPTTTALTGSASATFGGSTTFTATVANGGGTPTGSVVFTDGGVPIGTVGLNGAGVAALAIGTLSVGSHTVVATYQGDANYLGSASAGFVHTTNKANACTSAPVATPGTSVVGQSVSMLITCTSVNAVTPTGAVTLVVNNATIPGQTANLSSGSVTLTAPYGSPGLVLGSANKIQFNYSGDSNYNSTSVPLSPALNNYTVSKATPTATVSAPVTAIKYGGPVTFTTTVTAPFGSGTPTGTVTFQADGVAIAGGGAVALASGSATFTTSALAGKAGPYSITVLYNGDSQFNTATSPGISLTVNPADTTASVSAASTSLNLGQSTLLTATVTSTAGTPGGSVQFRDGATLLSTQALVGGSATFTPTGTPPLAAGVHNITAVYVPTAPSDILNYAGSTSTPVAVSVNKGGVTMAAPTSSGGVTFQHSANPTTLQVTLTPAIAGPGQPAIGGTVQFYDGVAPIGAPATVTAGLASLSTTLPVGSHSISAAYLGDASYLASTSNSPGTSITVSKNTTALGITPPAITIQYGTAFTVPVTLTPASATGTVTLRVGGNTLGTTAVAGGVGTVNVSAANAAAFLAVGPNALTADYDGDANNAIASTTGTVNVGKADTTIGVASSANPSASGQSVTFTATVSVAPGATGVPTGSVDFSVDGVSIGTGVLTGGVTSVAAPALVPGNPRLVRAVYSGDPRFNGSNNNASPLNQVVNAGTVNIAVLSNKSPSAFGEAVTLTATVTAAGLAVGTPAGNVQFLDGGVAIGGPVALVAGAPGSAAASLAYTFTLAGNRSITATFTTGNGNFASGGPSAAWTQVVNKADTTTTLGASPVSPSVYRQTVTLTATVSSIYAGTPSGSFEFYDGQTLIGTAPLTLTAPFTGSISTTTLAVGVPHSLTARYVPDGPSSFSTSTSGAVPYVVNKADTVISAVAITAGNPANGIGTALSFTVNVTAVAPGAGNPTGTISFSADGSPIGTASLASPATLVYSGLSAGSHTITATYAGDANFNSPSGVAPAPLPLTVSRNTPAVAVVAGPASPVYGQAYTLTATITPVAGFPINSGTVAFESDGAGISGCGAASVAGGTASCTVSGATANLLLAGAHNIRATYSGDGAGGNYNSNISPTLGVTVTPANVQVDVASSAATANFGQAITFTATASVVAPGAFAPLGGNITFKDGAATLCANINVDAQGRATCTMPTGLSIGNHSITATYSGDANRTQHAGSQPTQPFIQTVSASTVDFALVSSNATTAVYSQPVTFTVTVSAHPPASGTPSGSVTFRDGGTAIGSVQTLVGGVASVTVSNLTGGTHAITAVYGGDSSFQTGTSSSLTQVVLQADATVDAPVATNGPPAIPVYGQTVTLTARVRPTAPATGQPSGQVVFSDNGNQIGNPVTVDPITGNAVLTTTSLSVGAHGNIRAQYLGDSNFKTNTSAAAPVLTINRADTTTVTTDITPVVYGASVILTATVAPVAPGAGTLGGTVNFYDGSVTPATLLGQANLSGANTASITIAAVPPIAPATGLVVPVVGGHNIIAVYSGNANFNGSTAPSKLLAVSGSPTSTVVTTSGSPSVVGQSVTFTATVTPSTPGTGVPTGRVQFFDGAVLLGEVALGVSGGSAAASFTVPGAGVAALTIGSHSISARYPGDGNYGASNSPLAGSGGVLIQVVDLVSTNTTLTSTPNSSVLGQTVTLTATVTAVAPGVGIPTGQVEFISLDGLNGAPAQNPLLGTAVLVAGPLGSNSAIATLTTTVIPTGNIRLRADYKGDTNNRVSSSAIYTQVVNKPGVTVTVASNLNPSILGQPVTYTATVTPAAPATGVPTGNAQFFDGTTLIATVQLTGGQATYTTTLGAGAHSVGVSYGGDSNFQGAISPQILQTVSKIPSAIAITSSSVTAVASQVITLTATISPNAPAGVPSPSGQVQFFDGSQIIGVGAVSSGVAAITLNNLGAGQHNIAALYLGDDNWTGTTSAFILQTISRAGTTTSVTSSVNPSVTGQPVTFTVSVNVNFPGTVPANGQVVLYDNNNAVSDRVNIVSGRATVTVPGLLPGQHNIIAEFRGTESFDISTSAALTQNVNKAPTVTTLVATPSSSTASQQVALTAVVTVPSPGAGAPTGSVEFIDNTTTPKTLGKADLKVLGGVYTASINTEQINQAGAPRVLTAVYSGDNSFATSTSQPVGQSVFASPITVLNAAGYFGNNFAPDSYAVIFGSNLADTTLLADGAPYPNSLAGTSVRIKDQAGVERTAQLVYVSPGQINMMIPSQMAFGLATVTVQNPRGATASSIILVTRTAPGLFAANADGQGVAAAQVVRVRADGSQSFEQVATYDSARQKFVSLPLDLGPSTERLYLVLYGTGIRYRPGDQSVTARIDAVDAPVSYAGAQPLFPGLDQVNIEIPRSLAGRGEQPVKITVDGQDSNSVSINIR